MRNATRAAIVAVAALLGACAAGGGNKPAAKDYAPQSQDKLDASAATRARTHTELAAGYYSLGNFAVALQETAEALKADPNYAPAYNTQGLIYMALQDDAAAEQNFQRALRVAPGDPELNNNYGWFLCQRKREQDAIQYFMAALRNPLYTTPEKAWLNAGLCVRQKDPARAEEYFKQALALRPGDAQTLASLAELAYAQGDYLAARAYLARLPANMPQTVQMLWLQLRLAHKLGDRDAEASYGFQLRRNFPASREAQALRAGQFE